MRELAVRDKLRRYVRLLGEQPGLAPLVREINAVGEAYIFGGAARDVVFAGKKLVNDLDIVVSGKIDPEMLSKFSEQVRRTNFGGYRIHTGEYEVDLWEIQNSYAFRFDSPSIISVHKLLDTVCFSTDAIAVSLESGRVFKSKAFDESLRSRRLDFVVPPSKFEPVVAARIARLVLKLKLEMTPSVASYFVPCVEKFGISAVIDSESRWKDRRMLNEIRMEQVRTELRLAISKAFEMARNVQEPCVRQRELI
jgi:hypothetical protein